MNMTMKLNASIGAAVLIASAAIGSTAQAQSADYPAPTPRPTSTPIVPPESGTDTTFKFTGTCTDCVPNQEALFPVSGSLTLRNYALGDPISYSNFISFIYDGSPRIPEGFTILNQSVYGIGGSIGSTLPGSYGVTINAYNAYFQSSTSGSFDLGTYGVPLDMGFNGTYAAAALDTPAVPEPATWLMLLIGFGFIGVRARRSRQRASVTFA